MSAPPKTVLDVSPEEAGAIRAAVLTADLSSLGLGRALAGPADAADLAALLADPQVSDAIYDLPRPFTEETMAGWIAESAAPGVPTTATSSTIFRTRNTVSRSSVTN